MACSQTSSICTMTLNDKSAKDNFKWHGKYTKRMDCDNGKCSQVRHLTLNKSAKSGYATI